MKWFIDTFLKSLDERLNQTEAGQIWVTEKQVDVLRRYMKPCEYAEGYYIIVGDYQYTLHIMKKGYGKFFREDKRVAFHQVRRKRGIIMKNTFYRVRAELTDRTGNIVHTTPIARCATLEQAKAHARVWANGKQMGVYEVCDGHETKVF